LDLQHPEQAIPLSVEAPTNSLPQASTPLRAGLPLKIQRKNSEDSRSRPAGAAAVKALLYGEAKAIARKNLNH
jgi:hypothetical protein